MCKHDVQERRSSSPASSSTSGDSSSTNCRGSVAFKTLGSNNPRRTLNRQSSSMQETGLHVTMGSVVSALVVVFSLYFPFVFSPQAAIETYQFSFWNYDDAISHFDNTAWTYGTDYFLAFVMFFLIRMVPCHKDSCYEKAGWLTRGLLASYMFSVTAGGLAHQFYTTTESRNSWDFRLLWTVCVGTVSAASGFMGATATELVRIDHDRGMDVLLPDWPLLKGKTLPIVPEWFWFAYAFCVTITVALGAFSCQRPACDIFIAGITQFPSTFYLTLIFQLGLPKCHFKRYMRKVGCLSFLMNAPLLPMYPLLVQYTDWSLASVNTLLHSWLLVTWSLQGLSLRHVGNGIRRTEQENGGQWMAHHHTNGWHSKTQ